MGRNQPATIVWQIVDYWEAPAVAFNLIQGCAGLVYFVAIPVVGGGSYLLFANIGSGILAWRFFAVFSIPIYDLLSKTMFYIEKPYRDKAA